MPLDANTEYEIERAKKLLDSYAKEFGEADQCDLRVYQAGEILGRLMPSKAKKSRITCSAEFTRERGWSCPCGLPNPNKCAHAAGG